MLLLGLILTIRTSSRRSLDRNRINVAVVACRGSNGRSTNVLVDTKVDGLLTTLGSVVIRTVDVLKDIVEGVGNDGTHASVTRKNAVGDVPGSAVRKRPPDDIEKQ